MSVDPELLLTAACFLGGALFGASAAAVLRREAVPDARPLPVEPAEAPVVAPRATRTLAPAIMSEADQARLAKLREARNAAAEPYYRIGNRCGFAPMTREDVAAMREVAAAYRAAVDACEVEVARLAVAEVPVAWAPVRVGGIGDVEVSCGPVCVSWGTDGRWCAYHWGCNPATAPRLRDALHLLAEQSPEAAEAVRALGGVQ